MLPWFLSKGSQNIYVEDVDYVVLDFETTNIKYGSALDAGNRIVLACWLVVKSDGSVEKKECWGDEFQQQELVADCLSAKFIVAHNAKFELQWLSRCGLDLTKVVPACTMLAQWVIDGNLKTPKSLDALGQRYGLGGKGVLVPLLMDAGVCPSEIPRDWLLDYCHRDVELCHELFLIQREKLRRRKQLHIWHTRNLCCAVLADIEFNGMTLDPTAVSAEYKQTVEDYQLAEDVLKTYAEGVNINSPKQLASFLYDTLKFKKPIDPRTGLPKLTKGGALATDAETISQLVAAPGDLVQAGFLEAYKTFNKLGSLLSKNLEFFKGVCDEYGGTFYGQFNQGITSTHRLSSSGRPLTFKFQKKEKSTQFQNMPRQYKGLFWSGNEDYLIGEADGAQLEFRMAAELCADSTATDEIVNDVDVHSITAQTLTDAGEPTTRQQAKASTFAPLFGGMGKTKAQKEYAEFFKRKYIGITETQNTWKNNVVVRKLLRTALGMIYFWPNVKVNRYGYNNHTTEINNYPINLSGLAR